MSAGMEDAVVVANVSPTPGVAAAAVATAPAPGEDYYDDETDKGKKDADDAVAPADYPGMNVDDENLVGAEQGGIDAVVVDTPIDATGVAVVMSEKEEAFLESQKRKRYLCCGSCFLCLACIAVIVPVAIVLSREDDVVFKTNAPTSMPSFIPTAAPTSNPTSSGFADFVSYLLEAGVSDSADLERLNSPQYMAATWIVDVDASYWSDDLGLEVSDERVLQRYALAAFYYSTGGDLWRFCGKDSTSCTEVEWLTATTECDWLAVTCGDNDVVERLNFPATGNRMKGYLPKELSLLSNIELFLIPNNDVGGKIDDIFLTYTALNTFVIESNVFTGSIPPEIFENNPGMRMFDVGDNRMTGPMPSVLPSVMLDFNLNDNKFSGTIPTEIGLYTDIINLDLQTNNFEGAIPNEIFGLTKLQHLHLQNNTDLSGTLAESIASMSSLQTLTAGFSNIGGALPEGLYELTLLSKLILSDGNFTGSISEDIANLNATLMELLINNNGFTGTIPQAFDALTALEQLQLQFNELTGTISQAVCDQRGLKFQELATLYIDCAINCTCFDRCYGEDEDDITIGTGIRA